LFLLLRDGRHIFFFEVLFLLLLTSLLWEPSEVEERVFQSSVRVDGVDTADFFLELVI
jgi:hypothetical protein